MARGTRKSVQLDAGDGDDGDAAKTGYVMGSIPKLGPCASSSGTTVTHIWMHCTASIDVMRWMEMGFKHAPRTRAWTPIHRQKRAFGRKLLLNQGGCARCSTSIYKYTPIPVYCKLAR